jgi:Tol biopolymer transport system component
MFGSPRLVHRLGTCLLTLAAISAPLAAQYFGQNRVRPRTLNFKVLKTEHFDIYYYDEAQGVINDVARMAERWYARLSKILNHELSSRQPFILYSNHPDFRGTTAIPSFIGETTGGVTEALRRRMVLPLAGPMADTDHVIGHELVHAFQYDITSRVGPEGGTGLPGALRLPLWFIEGMAEYLSLGPVHSHTAMWLRDAVRREKVPSIRDLYDPQFFPYRYGHAFWAFVAGRYGDDAVGRMLRAAGRAGTAEGAIQSVLQVSPEDLAAEWRRALENASEPVLQRTQPANQQAKLLFSKEKSGAGGLNVSPVISPDGRHVVFFSERDLFSIDLFLAEVDTGRILRKLTKTAVDPHFDSFQFVNSAGAWSADGRRFAFGSVRSGRAALSVYDVAEKKVTVNIRFNQIGELYNPSWSPDGNSVAFAGNVEGVMDLFIVDLQTRALRRLTNDAFADVQPAWSPDGTHLAFSTDRFTSNPDVLEYGAYRLALLDLRTGRIQQLEAFPSGKHINPQWSPDSRAIYFISDRDGVPNIYRLDLATRRLSQVTNVQSGVAGISELSPAFSVASKTERLIFSAFEGGDYSLYLMEAEAARRANPPSTALAGLRPAALPPLQRDPGAVAAMLQQPMVGLIPRQPFPVDKYRPKLSLDYIAPPEIGFGVSNFGVMLGGGMGLYFSDLLGFHNVMTAFQTSTVGDATNFHRNLAAIGAYQNQRTRWNWGFLGGQVPFLTGAYGRSFGRIAGEPAVIERTVTFWQINRQASGLLSYPFNRAQRIEFSLGYQNISFAGEERLMAYSLRTGQFLGQTSQSIPTVSGLHMGTASTALVYDTSIFGGVSPVVGQSYRLEVGGVLGSVDYSTLLADYRRYIRLVRPLTLAGRALHFGRYGGGAMDSRLQDLFLGFPALVRGYDPTSYTVQDCPPASETGECPAFDRLFGSRIGVANAELRLQLLGFLGVIPSRSFPPVELAPFFDAGVAWGGPRRALRDARRNAVTSQGVSLRFNILGFAIGQLSYVRPNDRPRRDWMWQFSLLPGF